MAFAGFGMIDWFKKKPRTEPKIPGPTRTGRFIRYFDWWFWDGRDFPGLVTDDNFEKLVEQSLLEQEIRELGLARVASGTLSMGGHPRTDAIEVRERLFSKVSEYLQTKVASSAGEAANWIEIDFQDNCFRALKAYLNILSIWNYPYDFFEIQDARGREAIVVTFDGAPANTICASDVRALNGRPFRFQATIPGGDWHFEESDGYLKIIQLLGMDERGPNGFRTRTVIVGAETVAKRQIDQFWKKYMKL